MTDEQPIPRQPAGENSTEVLTIQFEEVDVANASAFLAELLSGEDLSSPVVIDLARVTFMDSTGVKCLIEATRRRRTFGGDIVLAGAPRTIDRILQVTGLHRMVDVYPSVEEARNALSAERA